MKISSPLFKTNGLEELLTGDVYKLKDAIPINKVYEAAKNLGSKLFDQVGGREGLVNGVAKLVAAKRQGLSGKELLDQGLSVFGTSKSAILSSSGKFILEGAGEYLDIDPSIVNQIKIIGNGIDRDAYGADTYTMNQLFEVLGTLSTDESYLSMINVGMEAAVWGSTISQAVKYNIPEVFDYIAETVDPATLHLSMIYSSSAVMTQGDLDSLLKLMTQLTPDEILGNNADFIKYFLASFKISPSWDATLYEEKAALLKETMNTLNPSWYTYKRQPGETIINLAALSTLSTDAKTFLQMDEELHDPIQIAPDFPATSTYAICQQMYPLSVASLK